MFLHVESKTSSSILSLIIIFLIFLNYVQIIGLRQRQFDLYISITPPYEHI